VSQTVPNCPFTLLYGASGVGKTSVLAAGVVPYLRAMPDVLVVLYRSWTVNRGDYLRLEYLNREDTTKWERAIP